jgi:hypothetical protein
MARRIGKKRLARLIAQAKGNKVGGIAVVAGPAPGLGVTRYDINGYGGGAGHIRKIGQVKKRRPSNF